DQSGRVHRDGFALDAELILCTVEEVDVRHESRCRTSDDREGKAEVVPRRADDRVRAATDTHPGGQSAGRSREDTLVLQSGPGVPLPGDGLLLQQLRQQVEALLEKFLVLAQVE